MPKISTKTSNPNLDFQDKSAASNINPNYWSWPVLSRNPVGIYKDKE